MIMVTMSMWLAVGLGLYCVIVVICSIYDGLCSFVETDDYALMTPITLHDNTDMNWFGCIASWLLFGLVSPIVFIFKLFYFLFHL